MTNGRCDTVGELTWDFAFCICKCFGLARVTTDFFYFIQRTGQKAQERPLRYFHGFGEKIIDREGISTLSLHGFPWALRCLLIILKLLVCLCFEKFFVLLRYNPGFCLQECYEVFLKTLCEGWRWEKVWLA